MKKISKIIVFFALCFGGLVSINFSFAQYIVCEPVTDCGSGYLTVPDPNDCQKFYTCSDYTPSSSSSSCGDGYYFEPDTQTCEEGGECTSLSFCFFEQECVTWSNKPCVFPFKYEINGPTYTACPDYSRTCATKVDSNFVLIVGGLCNPDPMVCPYEE
ncbi:chitin binding peritrophin-A domain-containing protein [Candidatus Albibeggiatoa sp. nov. BB20]|uniref:chitin binding peritrophin-A domain-containing protein n=1 Tax=Candidatus Albibeggiatoa sp. nov. BB20 TaxID=3162723 RepID=UPI0033654237